MLFIGNSEIVAEWRSWDHKVIRWTSVPIRIRYEITLFNHNQQSGLTGIPVSMPVFRAFGLWHVTADEMVSGVKLAPTNCRWAGILLESWRKNGSSDGSLPTPNSPMGRSLMTRGLYRTLHSTRVGKKRSSHLYGRWITESSQKQRNH